MGFPPMMPPLGPEPPGMGMEPPDMEDSGPEIDAIAALQEMLEALQPKYPSWLYKRDRKTGMRVLNPPKKPTKQQFDDWISFDATRFGELQDRFREDIRLYRQMGSGRPRDFDPDFDAQFISSEPTVQINKVAAMISGTPPNITFPYRTKTEREDAEALETWATWFLDSWSQHHRQAGSSELMWDVAWSALIYGRQVVRVTCDLEDGDFPWQIDVIDPATCFPTWGKGKHGLIRMSRKYIATVGEVLDEFDVDGRKGLLKKLSSHIGQEPSAIDYDREVEVSECWTRWHRYVEADSIVVMEPTAHEYGVVPFIYNMAPGEMGQATAPNTRTKSLTRREILAGYSGNTARSRQFDLAEKGVSFLHAIRNTIAQKEEIVSMHKTALMQTLNPATITTNPYPTPVEPLDLGPGGNNERKPGQQTVPAIPSPKPLDSQPLIGILENESAKGGLPDVIFGQVDASNVSGFASDTLMAAAKDRIQPFISLTEKTLEDVFTLALLLFRNFGHAADGLSNGELVIPRQRRGGPAMDGVSPARPPQWAMPIMQRLMEQAFAPGGTFGPPMLPQGAPAGPPAGGPPMPSPDMIAQAAAGGTPAVRGTGGAPPMMSGMQVPGMPQGMMAPPPPPPPPPGTDGNPTFPMVTGMRPSPMDSPDVRITRDMIDRSPGRPQVRINNIGLQNRTMLANYLSMLVQGKLISRALAMDNIPEIQNSVVEWERILAEDAMTNPDMLQKIYHPRMLWQTGDVDGFFTYWATVLLPQMAQSFGGGAPQGPPPIGAGGPPPPAPPSGPQTVQGDSNPMVGQPPGANGAPVGRPGMAGGPPPGAM